MDKTTLLCNKNETILRTFSRKCTGRLREHMMFRFFISLFNNFMDDNVQKEIDKDRLIIEYAAEAFNAGSNIDMRDVDAIFEKTKDIDNIFLKKVSVLPLSIYIRYADIKQIRTERISTMVRTVFDLLGNWGDDLSFAEDVKNTFTEKEFQEILFNILHLYNLETRIISKSIGSLPLMTVARDAFVNALFDIMEKTAEVTAYEYREKIFGKMELSCHDSM